VELLRYTPAYDAGQWAVPQPLIAEAPQRAGGVGAALGVSTDDVLQWVLVLTVVEVCSRIAEPRLDVP
jgi:hypothetical protein